MSVNDKNKFKILWNSNAVHAPTGYGVQTANIVFRVKAKGYDIRVAANYGLEAAALGFNGVIQYPKLFSQFGEDALQLIMANRKPDIFITLYDIWIGNRSPMLGKDWFSKLHPRWIPWIPIDHYPIPDPVAAQAKLAFRPVAMSEFGLKELKRIGLDKAILIPHGVETITYKPKPKKESRAWLEKHTMPLMPSKSKVQYAENDFVIGLNCANKDPIRKDYGRMFTAFQIFLDQNPDAKKDAKFNIHSWIKFPGGFDLIALANKLGISQYMKCTFPYDMYCAMTPESMATMYNGLDVFINLARGGGFEIPIIEAEACGTPVIATDYTAMTELVKGHGWLIPAYAGDIKCPPL